MPLKQASSAGSQHCQSLNAETSAGLATLPTETLELIFSNFCLHCRYNPTPDSEDTVAYVSSLPDPSYSRGQHQQKSDEPSWYSLDRHALFSLCLMSRRFRDIAQPFLYHEFALGAGDSWRSDCYAWDGRLPSFLRTVAERRDLAGLVRRVCVHPFLLEKWCVMVDGEVDQDSAAAANSTQHLSARLLGIKPGHYLGQFPTPPPGNNHVMLRVVSSQLLGLVMAALPNMEHLSLQYSRPSIRIPAAALDVAGFTGLHLKTVEVSSCPAANSQDHSMFNLYEEAIGVLEKTPNLLALNLHMCGSTGPAPAPSLPKLRVLRITHSRLSRVDLNLRLSKSIRLDTFLYEEVHPDPSRTGPQTEDTFPAFINSHCRPSDIIMILGRHLLSSHPHNETLKSLHLDFRSRPISVLDLSELIRPIPSLRGFTALKKLFLNSDMIFPPRYVLRGQLAADHLTQRLPNTIVTLQLAGRVGSERRPWLTSALLGLAQAVSQGAFAHLREVSCDAAEEDLAGDGEQEAARLFENAGVRFGYRYWPLSKAVLDGGDVPPSLE